MIVSERDTQRIDSEEKGRHFAHLHLSGLVAKTNGLEGDVLVVRLRFRKRRRIEGPNFAAHPGHDLLETPVVGDAEGVDEAAVVHDVVVQLVETDELLTVEGAAVSQPLAADQLAHGADRLQGLARHLLSHCKVR